MKLGKMMACAAVLSCSYAIGLNTESALGAKSQNRQSSLHRIIDQIREIDPENDLGFMGAWFLCANNHVELEDCANLEEHVKVYYDANHYVLKNH